MTFTLAISIVAVFVSVAALSALAISRALSWATPERKALRELTPTNSGVLRGDVQLTEEMANPALKQLSKALPKSPKSMSQLRRQLIAAGFYELNAAVYYSASKVLSPVILGGLPLFLMGTSGWMFAGFGALIGYLGPDLVLGRLRQAHVKAITHGLPDALDLMIVCVEAGSSLDQSIVKASDELQLAHPAVARELRMITTEIRAGKPRLEAFRNFAARTRVDDVRSLVTLLTQTDRFGTSVAQALRIHSETSRTKRRQVAEEKAGKIGVKLVFPLVLCIFPAVYVVCLGPAAIAIYHVLLEK